MKLIIAGKFPTLNEYILKCRVNPVVGNRFKQKWEKEILKQVKDRKLFERPVTISYSFYEENKRRDADNVFAFFSKVFQDALVSAGVLKDDSRKYVTGFEAVFYEDKLYPRIEVEIKEKEDGTTC